MSLQPGYFERMYAASDDPWGFETRWYERRKRALTLACLPEALYAHVFEPGCATGLLTEALAHRCDELLATDVAEAPLAAACRLVAKHPHVRVVSMAVPHEWPTGQVFDLVVLSEVGYYLDHAALDVLIERITECLAPGGTLLACHWRHSVADYPVSGDDVHAALAAGLGMAMLAHHDEVDFLLDVWCRPPALSVARRSGLVL